MRFLSLIIAAVVLSGCVTGKVKMWQLNTGLYYSTPEYLAAVKRDLEHHQNTAVNDHIGQSLTTRIIKPSGYELDMAEAVTRRTLDPEVADTKIKAFDMYFDYFISSLEKRHPFKVVEDKYADVEIKLTPVPENAYTGLFTTDVTIAACGSPQSLAGRIGGYVTGKDDLTATSSLIHRGEEATIQYMQDFIASQC